MNRLILIVFVLVGCGMTQIVPSEPEAQVLEMIQLIEGAQEEVLLITPGIHSQTLAEALREAVVVRGVAIYLLASPKTAEDRASYVTSLELAGARVRLTELRESFLVVDRQQVIASVLGQELEVARAVTQFYDAFRAAPVYDPTHFTFLQRRRP